MSFDQSKRKWFSPNGNWVKLLTNIEAKIVMKKIKIKRGNKKKKIRKIPNRKLINVDSKIVQVYICKI